MNSRQKLVLRRRREGLCINCGVFSPSQHLKTRKPKLTCDVCSWEAQEYRCKSARYKRSHRKAALAYQRRHHAVGLCYICPRKAYKGCRCKRHYKPPF